MPDRLHHRDLQIEVDHDDKVLVFDAEWRPEEEQWVCEDRRWTIRLTPYGGTKIDIANSFCFKNMALPLYRKVRGKLKVAARDELKRHA